VFLTPAAARPPFTCEHRLPVRPGTPFTMDQCRPCWIDAGGDHRAPVAGVTDKPPAPSRAARPAPPPVGPEVRVAWCASGRVWRWYAYRDGAKVAEGSEPKEAEARAEAEAALGTGVVVNQGAGGIGDALQGLWVSKAVRQAEPGREVTYRLGPRAFDFVRLFDGYDHIGTHERDEAGHLRLGGPARQLNEGYILEEQHRLGAEPRIDRYCRNAGVPGPVRPLLRDPERVRQLGQRFAGCVVLAPISAGPDREYSLPGWRAVGRLLHEAGYRTVVTHRDAAEYDQKGADRLRGFASEMLLDRPADEVAGLILNAACFIGGDSGLAHLAGTLGTPGVVLCGPTRGTTVFSHYPSLTFLEGVLGCTGCNWQPKAGWAERACKPACPNLQSIDPARVVAAVKGVTRG
jgi:hypothetical protein